MAINLIVKKLSKCLKVGANSLLFGDVRSQISRDLLNNLTDVIDRKSNHPNVYYILVHAAPDLGYKNTKVIKERIILLDRVPTVKLIGTLLFRIDNKNADAEMVWCLPSDIPMIAGLKPERNEKSGDRILQDAKGLPIFNRTMR